MPCIAFLFKEFNNPFRFKAPRHTMYSITDIHATNGAGGGSDVFVMDYLTEDEIVFIPEINQRNFIAHIPTDIAGTFFDFNFTIPIKTKFISVHQSGNVGKAVYIVINYELIKATRTELIMEWFRKGI